jgi:hypothetical protein
MPDRSCSGQPAGKERDLLRHKLPEAESGFFILFFPAFF